MHNTTLIINRPCCPIFNSLCHIIDINIITKNLSSISVFIWNRCPCKTNKSRIRQCIMNYSGIANDCTCFFLTFFIFWYNHSLIETILTTMGFICHDHNISSFRQWLFSTFKLKHGCENNAICCSSVKQRFQMLFAFSLYRRLSEEIRTLRKLCIKLVIQIYTVCHNNNRWAFQSFLQ